MADVPVSFDLLGHDCPYGSYPAPVIPVGRLRGRLVAVYPGGEAGPKIEEVDDNLTYVVHNEQLKKSLKSFDYRVHRLFGFSPLEVSSYPASREAEFLDGFLGTAAGSNSAPNVRKMLEDHCQPAGALSRKKSSRTSARARLVQSCVGEG